ncbi:MAG: alpha/beta hydrolase [Actinomycetota bacterium]
MDGTIALLDGGHLAFEDVGDGPAVVLLHPGLWDMRTWDPQIAPFTDAGYRVIRYDLRGYGLSSRPSAEPYSHVADLCSLLDRLDVEQAALVGCSMGGAVAIDTAITAPGRVWALVLVAAGLSGFEPTAEEEGWWENAWSGIEEAVEAGELLRAQDLRLGIWAPLGTDDAAGATIRRIAFDNIHELTMDESAEIELDPPAAHRLHEIDAPTLVLKAEHDPADMRRISDLVAAGIPGARIVMIDADHVVNLRQPAAFDAAVLPFLAEVRP